MKILLCHNYYAGRGGESNVFNNDKNLLEKNGHEVIIYTRDNSEICNYGFIKKIGFFLETIFSVRTYFEIKQIIKTEKPDVAHIHNIFPLISPSIYYALHNNGIPIFQSIHNFRIFCPNALFLNPSGNICEKCRDGKYFRSVNMKCYRNSSLQSFVVALVLFIHHKIKTFQRKIDFYITANHFTETIFLESGIPKNKIIVKAYVMDFKDQKPSDKYEKYVLYAGRLSREKGLKTLIKAFEKCPTIPLKIIGAGLMQPELETMISQENISNIEFMGYVSEEEKMNLIKKAMFTVFPTECYEHQPYSVIESLACGVPVVASCIGGVKEMVKDKYSGLFFETGNATDLADKISYLFNNQELIPEMKTNARMAADDKYSESVGYKNIMNIYKRAMKGN